MNLLARFATIACVLAAPAALAQEQQPAPAAEAAPWSTRCISESRTGPTDCILEQRVVIGGTSQLLVGAQVVLPAKASLPRLVLQTPVGLYLPAGIRLAVDDRPLEPLPLRTCDASGCFAEIELGAQAVISLKQGSNLTVTFQDLSQRDIAVPVSLRGFTAAFDKGQ